jgi:LmbE family N-acetylglucosaminyl deacetylase
MTESLDVFAAMAHPDDAKLLCESTPAASTAWSERVGALSLTRR